MLRRYRIRPRFGIVVAVVSLLTVGTVVRANQKTIPNPTIVKALQVRSMQEYRMHFPKVPTSPKREGVSLRVVASAYGVSGIVLNKVIQYLPTAYRVLPKASFLPAVLGIVATETKGQNGLYNSNPNGTWDGGIAQVNSVNWALYGMDWNTVQDVHKNLYAASHILWKNYTTFRDLRMAFAAYNEGATAVAMGEPDPTYVQEAWSYTKAFRFLLAHRY